MRYLSKNKTQPRAPKAGEFFFPFSTVSGDICWDTSLALGPADWKPGKTDQSQQRVRIFTKVSSPSSLYVVPGEERKVKFHVVLSFPNSDGQAKQLVRIQYFICVLYICFWVLTDCRSFLSQE